MHFFFWSLSFHIQWILITISLLIIMSQNSGLHFQPAISSCVDDANKPALEHGLGGATNLLLYISSQVQ